jgi:hypothetical protein
MNEAMRTAKCRGLLLILSGLGALALFSAPAQANPPVTVSCGQTLTHSVKLANDLSNCPNNGLVVGADNVTVDLNGHTIDGDGDGFDSCATDCDAGVDNTGHARITVKHGTIREFVEGVAVEGARANRVERDRDRLQRARALPGCAARPATGPRSTHVSNAHARRRRPCASRRRSLRLWADRRDSEHPCFAAVAQRGSRAWSPAIGVDQRGQAASRSWSILGLREQTEHPSPATAP